MLTICKSALLDSRASNTHAELAASCACNLLPKEVCSLCIDASSLLPSGASSSQGPLPQGRLQAKVVAADSIRASDTLKEVVVYKIRAADARGEWTVSRRYSNFEQLHRQLRDVSHPDSCKFLPHGSLQLCTY